MDDPKKLTKVAPQPMKGIDVGSKPEDVTPKGETPPKVEEKKPGGQVVHWKDRMSSLVGQTQQAEKPAGGLISLKGGRMSYGDELLPGDKINAILIDYRKDNEFFPDKYDASKPPVSPVCFAITRADPNEPQSPWIPINGTDVPEGAMEDGDFYTEAEKPQVESGSTCEDCPRNEWGSDLGGGRGKACKTSRRLHVLAADDCATVQGVSRTTMASMVLPATSVDNFSKFINQTSNVLKTPYFGVKVEVSVKPHPKFLFQVHFKILEQITDEDILEALMNRHEKQSQKIISFPKNSERGEQADAARVNRGSSKY